MLPYDEGASYCFGSKTRTRTIHDKEKVITLSQDIWDLIQAKNSGGGVARGKGRRIKSPMSPQEKTPQIWRGVTRYNIYQPVSFDRKHLELTHFVNMLSIFHTMYLQSFKILEPKSGELW